MSSEPTSVPSTLNCTPATATLSEALAENTIVPETVEPELGEETETAGGTVSPEGAGGEDEVAPPQALKAPIKKEAKMSLATTVALTLERPLIRRQRLPIATSFYLTPMTSCSLRQLPHTTTPRNQTLLY